MELNVSELTDGLPCDRRELTLTPSALIRRFDQVTVNAFVPPSITILFGAIVAIGIWYIGPRVQSQIIASPASLLGVPVSPPRIPDSTTSQADGQQAEGGHGGSREIEERGDMEEAGDLGVRVELSPDSEELEEEVTAEHNV